MQNKTVDKSVSDDDQINRSSSWKQSRRLCFILLAGWFIFTFATLFFARELSSVVLFGWPLSFYMAAQGLSLFYLGLLAALSIVSHRIHRQSSFQQQTKIISDDDDEKA